jgi:type IV secretory pathway protease TraF
MPTDQPFQKILATAAGVLLAGVLLAAPALAATEQTREGYVAQVEPICKANTKANEKILAGVRREIKQGKLKLAGGRFGRAATAFGKAVGQIRAIPQPSADRSRLAKWLGYLDKETALLREISEALKAGKKHRVQALSVRLTQNGNLTNDTVLGFGFNYCLIKQSRFT